MAKAEALRDGVRLIAPNDTRGIIAETDSVVLVSLWNTLVTHRSMISVILEDIFRT